MHAQVPAAPGPSEESSKADDDDCCVVCLENVRVGHVPKLRTHGIFLSLHLQSLALHALSGIAWSSHPDEIASA